MPRQQMHGTPGRQAHTCVCGSSTCAVASAPGADDGPLTTPGRLQNLLLQIINTVQSSARGSGLAVPPPDQLPAGPLGQYNEYVALMEVRAVLWLVNQQCPLLEMMAGGPCL